MVFFSDGTELNKFLGRGEGLGDEEFCQDSIGNVWGGKNLNKNLNAISVPGMSSAFRIPQPTKICDALDVTLDIEGLHFFLN